MFYKVGRLNLGMVDVGTLSGFGHLNNFFYTDINKMSGPSRSAGMASMGELYIIFYPYIHQHALL